MVHGAAGTTPFKHNIVAGDGASKATRGDEGATVHALLESRADSSSVADTFHTSGTIDRTNPFFGSMGINGRTSETCRG